MTMLWKELSTGIFILFLKLLGCPRTSLPLVYLGERGRKVRDGFLNSIFLHKLSRGKLEGGEGSAENKLTDAKTKCRSQTLAWSQLVP